MRSGAGVIEMLGGEGSERGEQREPWVRAASCAASTCERRPPSVSLLLGVLIASSVRHCRAGERVRLHRISGAARRTASGLARLSSLSQRLASPPHTSQLELATVQRSASARAGKCTPGRPARELSRPALAPLRSSLRKQRTVRSAPPSPQSSEPTSRVEESRGATAKGRAQETKPCRARTALGEEPDHASWPARGAQAPAPAPATLSLSRLSKSSCKQVSPSTDRRYGRDGSSEASWQWAKVTVRGGRRRRADV